MKSSNIMLYVALVLLYFKCLLRLGQTMNVDYKDSRHIKQRKLYWVHLVGMNIFSQTLYLTHCIDLILKTHKGYMMWMDGEQEELLCYLPPK